jgi:hypothetical protein
MCSSLLVVKSDQGFLVSISLNLIIAIGYSFYSVLAIIADAKPASFASQDHRPWLCIKEGTVEGECGPVLYAISPI